MFVLRFTCVAAIFCLTARPVLSGELVYVKKDTRRLTREASLEASRPLKTADKWWIIGPFPNERNQQFKHPYPPEETINLAAAYDGAGEPARWQEVRLPDGRVNSLRRFKNNDDVLCYLYRKIEVNEPTQVRISLGSNKGMAVWLNGEQLLSTTESRIATVPNQDFVTLELKPGPNDLLLKMPNSGRGGWSFYFEPTIENRLLTKLERQLDRDFPTGGEVAYYRIESLPLPDDEVVEVGALAFRPDGKLYVATRRGDIWLVSNPTAENVDDIEFTPFARGLHEVLGLCVVGNDVYCAQRPEVTLLRDTDGDDRADEYLTFCDAFGVSGDYHEYLYGPVRDSAGNLFITLNLSLGSGTGARAAYRGLALKILPDGSTVPWATGLRSPNGVNFSPDGRLFCTDNQGEWVATCKLQEVRQGEFYGHRGALEYWPGYQEGQYPAVTPPAVWLPFGLSRSATEPVWDTTEGKFGPFAGQCFVGELTNSAITRVFLEEVNGRMQGACFPFRKGFSSGVNRLAFAPDGSLMVGETNRGWGSLGGQIQGVERLVFTGKLPFEVHSMHVTPQGWDLRFTQPVDPARAGDLKNWLVESYTYHYWDTYGSPEIERKQHTFQLEVASDDPHVVHMALADRPLGKVYHVRMTGLRSALGEALLNADAYYTLNAVPESSPRN
jgi:glucose/arabinose dehydrogenase